MLTDPTVSRHHVELSARADGVRVRDLGSTNGVLIAGVRVQEAIVEEATLVVGRTELRIESQEKDLGSPLGKKAFGSAVGNSEAIRRLFGLLERAAPADSTILLLGETGTGKEVLARSIHESSQRRSRPFVVVDCGALAPNLVESELFGHLKGAFTGATADRDGAFIEASGGTVFLDEVGELPLELQPKLLRVLETGMVKRVGENKPQSVNVRVVAATHRYLEAEVKAGRFRADLFFRLAVIAVRVPPLRERREDLKPLVAHFVAQAGRGGYELSEELLTRLEAYDWPGNVRELRNIVERALAVGQVELSVPPPGGKAPSALDESLQGLPFKEAKERLVDAFSRDYLKGLFAEHKGNLTRMAKAAGLARNYVQQLVDKYGIREGK